MNLCICRQPDSIEAIARRLLAKESGMNPEEIVISRTENGKPVCSAPPFYFSGSHSGDYLACVTAQQPVGLDLEQVRPVHPRLLRALSPQEQAYMLALPQTQRDEGFFRLWTLKESWIKCQGGRLLQFRQAVFQLDGTRILSGPAGYSFSFLQAPAGYVLALCVQEENPL